MLSDDLDAGEKKRYNDRMDKSQARKTAYLIVAELIDVENALDFAMSSHLIESDGDAAEIADALAELREELVERADLDEEDDLELAKRYRKLNQQLEEDDHTQMIEKLRASAALWDNKLSK